MHASESEHPDLFWGVRGGGGNFGIVTSFQYRLHPDRIVISGLTLYPLDQASEVLHFFREVTETAPDELTLMAAIIRAPPAPFIPTPLQGTPMVGIVECWCGSIDDGFDAVRPLKGFGPPAVALLRPMPYRALQSILDAAAPP